MQQVGRRAKAGRRSEPRRSEIRNPDRSLLPRSADQFMYSGCHHLIRQGDEVTARSACATPARCCRVSRGKVHSRNQLDRSEAVWSGSSLTQGDDGGSRTWVSFALHDRVMHRNIFRRGDDSCPSYADLAAANAKWVCQRRQRSRQEEQRTRRALTFLGLLAGGLSRSADRAVRGELCRPGARDQRTATYNTAWRKRRCSRLPMAPSLSNGPPTDWAAPPIEPDSVNSLPIAPSCRQDHPH